MTETFTVDFGKAKRPELPPENSYTLVVETYEPREAKNAESREKGFNIYLVLRIEDPTVSSSMKVHHNLWVDYENPWAAKLFFEALTGRDLENDPVLGSQLHDADLFVGEKIGCMVIHDTYEKNGQTRMKLAPSGPDAWYTV